MILSLIINSFHLNFPTLPNQKIRNFKNMSTIQLKPSFYPALAPNFSTIILLFSPKALIPAKRPYKH